MGGRQVQVVMTTVPTHSEGGGVKASRGVVSDWRERARGTTQMGAEIGARRRLPRPCPVTGLVMMIRAGASPPLCCIVIGVKRDLRGRLETMS